MCIALYPMFVLFYSLFYSTYSLYIVFNIVFYVLLYQYGSIQSLHNALHVLYLTQLQDQDQTLAAS